MPRADSRVTTALVANPRVRRFSATIAYRMTRLSIIELRSQPLGTGMRNWGSLASVVGMSASGASTVAQASSPAEAVTAVPATSRVQPLTSSAVTVPAASSAR